MGMALVFGGILLLRLHAFLALLLWAKQQSEERVQPKQKDSAEDQRHSHRKNPQRIPGNAPDIARRSSQTPLWIALSKRRACNASQFLSARHMRWLGPSFFRP